MPLSPFQGEQVQVLTNDKLSTGMMQWADIILCAKNDTRHRLNAHMRELEDRGEEPEVGDKIICLRNYWDVISDGRPEEASPLVNGSLGFITSVEKQEHRILKIPVLKMSIETELGEKYSNLTVDYNLLMTGKPALTYKQYRERTRSYAKGQVPMPMEFAFGYAITTWKAQGSEWDKVLLIEENFPWEKEEKKRYLYTGVTRASEKLVVIKK
jgi:exodeoxyribonuclease-5